MLAWIIKSQNRATSVCLQKKKERKKERKKREKRASPSGVLRGRQRAWMGGLCIATERSPDLRKSIPTKQTHHLQNRHRNKTLCTASTSHRKDSTTDSESEKSSADASLHSCLPLEAAWHRKPQSAWSDWPACWATSEKRATQPSWVGSDVPSLPPCCDPAWHVSVGPPRAAKTQHQRMRGNSMRQTLDFFTSYTNTFHRSTIHFAIHFSPLSFFFMLPSLFLLLLSSSLLSSALISLLYTLFVWLLFHYCALSIKL